MRLEMNSLAQNELEMKGENEPVIGIENELELENELRIRNELEMKRRNETSISCGNEPQE